ncbi:hypothetical protein [Leptolyngbya sp. FACHB-16]|uniref:hypothetical protein n=1 Tax=unclassified Leptolyngbya TaxID=2650499 RepID=UPI001684995A|nr:hypothetical protein [Leptolyngbya sp. FACHB-16]MBD2156904.1 hypothetical protein [Leptolyngbya sp. FACHB-16]
MFNQPLNQGLRKPTISGARKQQFLVWASKPENRVPCDRLGINLQPYSYRA